MHIARRTLVATAVFMHCLAALSAVPSVEDFFKRPEISSPSVSPDARYVFYLTPRQQRYFDLNAFDFVERLPMKFDLGQEELTHYRLLSDGRMILRLKSNSVLFDPTQRKLIDIGGWYGKLYYLISQLKDRPDQFYVLIPQDWNVSHEELGIIDITHKSGLNGRGNKVGRVPLPKGELDSVASDQVGEIRAARLYDGSAFHYHYRRNDGTWLELPFDRSVVIKAFASDADTIYLIRRDDLTGSSLLCPYSIERKEFGPSLFQETDYSLDDCTVHLSADGKELLGLTYLRDRPTQIALSSKLKEIQDRINAAFPERNNIIDSWDEHQKRFVVRSSSARDLRWFTLERGLQRLSELTRPYPQLEAAALRPVRVVRYPTKDGLQLEGYLTLPEVGSAEPKPPLVVLPHEGPWERDTWGFDREAQFFASRGYAVFRPNYRGSTGYAKAVTIDGKFAFRKMYEDVTEGVRYLIGTEAIDGTRVGVVGVGFGSYVALGAVVSDPDLYRCAVTRSPVLEWDIIMGLDSPSATKRSNRQLAARLSENPEKDAESFREASPLNNLGRIKSPVLVAYARADDTGDHPLTKKLRAELEKHRVPLETLIFDGESNGNNENDLKFYSGVEKFLERTLKKAR